MSEPTLIRNFSGVLRDAFFFAQPRAANQPPRVSDRLDELRRQRAIVQQHLAWIESEIAAAGGEISAPKTAAPSAPSLAAKPPATPADALLEQYAAEEQTSPGKVKLGCWIAFVVLFAGFWGAVGVWYLLKTKS